ncbi:MAG: ectonucleotide pyrophosphatase/phosphodiesterase [Balneola sp.]
MKKLLVLLFLCSLACTAQPNNKPPKLLLISFDGFRADYLSKTETPNFDLLAKAGVLGEGLIPVFPSKTFPNYYSIATGLYPENNGFIGNSMYDPEMNLSFSMGDREQVENPDWYGGEPIWNTVEKNGLNAGTMFWVGSEAPIQNMRPTFWKRYDGRIPNESRIDSVLKWMTLGNENEIDFGTLYFSFVDSEGHRYGPDSEEVVQAIRDADELVGYLINQMKSLKLFESTNIIIVSDHGMTEVSRERLIVLDDLVNMEGINIISSTPVVMMNLPPERLENVYQILKRKEANYKVYRKENLPERFHLRKHPRVPDLIMIADLGYTINTREYIQRRENYPSGGTHGFDNREKEMHALFIARGPDFKEGYSMKSFENIHLYELMVYLLGIPSAGTDGSLDSVNVMLR